MQTYTIKFTTIHRGVLECQVSAKGFSHAHRKAMAVLKITRDDYTNVTVA